MCCWVPTKKGDALEVHKAERIKIHQIRIHEAKERTLRRSASRIYRKLLVSVNHLIFDTLLLKPTDNSGTPFDKQITARKMDGTISQLMPI